MNLDYQHLCEFVQIKADAVRKSFPQSACENWEENLSISIHRLFLTSQNTLIKINNNKLLLSKFKAVIFLVII